MKKILSLVFIGIFCLTLVGCGNNDNNSNNSNENNLQNNNVNDATKRIGDEAVGFIDVPKEAVVTKSIMGTGENEQIAGVKAVWDNYVLNLDYAYSSVYSSDLRKDLEASVEYHENNYRELSFNDYVIDNHSGFLFRALDITDFYSNVLKVPQHSNTYEYWFNDSETKKLYKIIITTINDDESICNAIIGTYSLES